MPTVIYGLYCPVAKAIRYIGKTTQPKIRMRNHLGDARRSGRTTYKHKWIASLLEQGLRPELRALQTVDDDGDWQECERRWIAYATECGWPLTNLAAGGDGSTPLNDEAKARKSVAMSKAETRDKMSASARARWSDPKKREIGLAAMRTEEARANHIASVHARATPEYRKAQSDRGRAAWSDPEKRARIAGGFGEAAKRAVSASAKRMWETADEAKKEKMLGNLRLAKAS